MAGTWELMHPPWLGITVFAYSYTRRHANNPAYTFGTGKVGALGGFTSAIVLTLIALIILWES
jgi:Co/Zn/Cd efflux system component